MTQPPNDRPDPGPWTPPPPPQGWTPPGAAPSPSPYPPQHQYQPPQPYQPQQQYRPQEGGVFTPQPAQPAPKKRAPLIASLVAVVALAGGGAITYVALSDSSESGAATPKEAVEHVVADMENSDLVGLLDDLAPGERDALANPVREDVDKLKELHVLNSDADPGKISGVTFRATNLVYGGKTIPINDHVQIVQLTGGKIDLTGDPSKLPLSDQMRKFVPSGQQSTTHFDLAENPVRIATQKVGGRWYPSLFYTAADSAAGHRVPAARDAIQALGSASAEDAVRDEVDALLSGDLQTALAHMSPAELGAVHDYGGMLLDQAPGWSDTGIKIKTLETTSSPLSGGGTHVGLKQLVLELPGSAQGSPSSVSMTISGSCVGLAAQGHTQNFCASDAADAVSGFLGTFACFGSTSDCDGAKLTQAQRTALIDLFTGLTKLGLATAEVDGKWYVNPVRSAVDVFGTLLGGLKGNDVFALATLGN